MWHILLRMEEKQKGVQRAYAWYFLGLTVDGMHLSLGAVDVSVCVTVSCVWYNVRTSMCERSEDLFLTRWHKTVVVYNYDCYYQRFRCLTTHYNSPVLAHLPRVWDTWKLFHMFDRMR